MSDFLERLRRDPDRTWHEYRRRVCQGPPVAVVFGQVLYRPRLERAQLLISLPALCNKVVIPARFAELLDEAEEIVLLSADGRATYATDALSIRRWTDSHLLIEFPGGCDDVD